jgi:hypothetical protein
MEGRNGRMVVREETPPSIAANTKVGSGGRSVKCRFAVIMVSPGIGSHQNTDFAMPSMLFKFRPYYKTALVSVVSFKTAYLPATTVITATRRNCSCRSLVNAFHWRL